tara:strand:+ start:294 stop:1388 length:1095 start_codon:yes stop_codon:yes gene_type:complete
MLAEIDAAEIALEHGDYYKCLKILNRLAIQKPIETIEGAKVRMLMITALMGKGDNEKAKSICRALTNCKDTGIKQRAKQLISVLEAPDLKRPENWSISLPKIGLETIHNENKSYSSKKELIKKNHDLPPTGPTKAFSLGYSIFLITILSALTLLLSGCLRVKANIDLPSQNLFKVNIITESKNENLLPWQSNFESSIIQSISKTKIKTSSTAKQNIIFPAVTTERSEELLKKIIFIASKSAGLKPIDSSLKIKETNLLLGIKQEIELSINLSSIKNIPGLEVLISITPSTKLNQIKGMPLNANKMNQELLWELKQGEFNYLKVGLWRLNKFGIGILLVLTMLLTSIILQRIRLQMGFGYPELPP